MRSFLFLLFGAVLVASRLINEFPFSSSEETNDSDPGGDIWAVLIAGSNGWWNYRHQADIAHAYHVLLAHGVHPEKIIVMFYDDIAHNKQNPYPGKLYNNPSKKDVYEGLVIDYKGEAVNTNNFYAVLTGNKTMSKGGNGRVLESTGEDRVFVYFCDHGATGLISIIDGFMTVKQLNEALNKANERKLYKQLVFYLESCESGSMFEKTLADNINVYAITAANGKESSWGTYCENPLKLPCLGDLFSVNWMEDSDVEQLASETIGDQYKLVKKETNQSHVQHFGDFTIEKEPVGWFQGMSNGRMASNSRPYKGSSKEKNEQAWPSRDIHLMYLTKELERENDMDRAHEIKQQIKDINERRVTSRHTFKRLVHRLVSPHDENEAAVHLRKTLLHKREAVLEPTCHHHVVHGFSKLCIDLNKHHEALAYVYILNNLCNHFMDADLIIRKMIDICVLDK